METSHICRGKITFSEKSANQKAQNAINTACSRGGFFYSNKVRDFRVSKQAPASFDMSKIVLMSTYMAVSSAEPMNTPHKESARMIPRNFFLHPNELRRWKSSDRSQSSC